ncbi:UDP-3-O-acylglucosamine N-acyltransferase [Candidatus Magnetomoraceae bacterium gMMP-1]
MKNSKNKIPVFSLDEITSAVNGKLRGGDPKTLIKGIAPFDSASIEHITFAVDKKLEKQLDATKAGAIIVSSGFSKKEAIDKALICVDNPYLAFAKAATLFHVPERVTPGISPQAAIGNDFICGNEIAISHGVVIGDHISIGSRVQIHPNSVIGNNVSLGDDVVIYPNVTIMHASIIGSRVIINSGCVIGSDGFGFAPDGEKYHKIPQMGIVQIDDDVEIGANTTIDRATFAKTWIQKGVKIDNLVQIGHNVVVGENTVIVSQVGISGSTTIGKHSVFAGQAGVGGHLKIGDNVTVGPQAGLAQSVSDNQVVSGTTIAMPHKIWLKAQGIIPRLPEIKKQINKIEKRLKFIEMKSER